MSAPAPYSFAAVAECDFKQTVPDVLSHIKADPAWIGQLFGWEETDGWMRPVEVTPEYVADCIYETVGQLVGYLLDVHFSRKAITDGIDPGTGRPWRETMASRARKAGCESVVATEVAVADECVGAFWEAFGEDAARRLQSISSEVAATTIANIDREDAKSTTPNLFQEENEAS